MASGAFGVGAYVALTLGLTTGRVAVVVVLSTLASAVTVMLSRIVEKAHVARHQWVAIAVTLLGLALIRGES
jgi:drug/metabolite transporter (DMT)-like permease